MRVNQVNDYFQRAIITSQIVCLLL